MAQRTTFVLTLIALIFSSPLLAQNKTDRVWYPRTITEILNQTEHRVGPVNDFTYGAWSVFDRRDNTKMTITFDSDGTMVTITTSMVQCASGGRIGWCDNIILDATYAHWFIFSRSWWRWEGLKVYWMCLVYAQPDVQPTKQNNFYCWQVQFKPRSEMLDSDGSPIGYYVYMWMKDPNNPWEAMYTNPMPFVDQPL